jgi:hypothetical protein
MQNDADLEAKAWLIRERRRRLQAELLKLATRKPLSEWATSLVSCLKVQGERRMPKAIEDQAFWRLPNLQLPLDLPIKDKTLKTANASQSYN